MSFIAELKRRNVIRVALAYLLIAWVLLQAADFALDLIDAPNWVIQVLFMLAALGLPAVMVFSWVFEMTPEGLKREHEVDRTQSITPQTGQKLNRVIIGALTLAVAYLLVDKLVLQDRASRPAERVATTSAIEQDAGASLVEAADAAAPKKPSVAVLPFVNMSGQSDNEYFSDGLTETLLHMLAQLPDLQVAARTSSFAFKGQNKSVDEIASVLGVAHILEGSVQRAGDKIRVTAQLIKADDGFHLWSETYDRDLTDIFAIQDEIATDVARSLDASLLGNDENLHGVDTHDTAAYDIYLQALEQQALGTYASLPIAESLFKDALARDPDFIDAKLGLVRNYQAKTTTGLIDPDLAWSMSEPLLQQVLAKEPDNPTAQLLEASFSFMPGFELDANIIPAALDRARSLLPLAPTESYIRSFAAIMAYFFVDDPRTPLDLLDAGLKIDPLEPELLSVKGWVLLQMDRHEESETWLMKAYEQAPNDPNVLSRIGDLKFATGELAAELDWWRRAMDADPRDHELAAELASRFYQLGLVEEGDRWTNRVLSLAPRSPVGRRVELERAVARGDDAQALVLARSMIEDNVAFRHDSYTTAVFTYADIMTTQDRVREGFDYFVDQRPEAMAFDGKTYSLNEAMTVLASLEWLPLIHDRDDIQAVWANAAQTFDHSLPRWRKNPALMVQARMLEGDLDAAKAIVLDDLLGRPAALNLDVPDMLARPFYAPIASDPDVQAALAKLDRQIDGLRVEVREILLEPEWNP